jgi:hypothetical protein
VLNAARMGHPRLIYFWRKADSSCLASLARRNDGVGGFGVYFGRRLGFGYFVDVEGLGCNHLAIAEVAEYALSDRVVGGGFCAFGCTEGWGG